MSWTGSEASRKTQRQLDARQSFSSPRYSDPIKSTIVDTSQRPQRKKPENRYVVAPGCKCLVKRFDEPEDAWRNHVTTKMLTFYGHVSIERDTITLAKSDWLLRIPRRLLVGTPVRLWSKSKKKRRKSKSRNG